MSWERYNRYLWRDEALGMSLDVSRMDFPDGFLESVAEPIGRALEQMRRLEAGAVANPDENRMVGHYWLRNPGKAPDDETREKIVKTCNAVTSYAAEAHREQRFRNLLLIGIGGSALGPQLLADALDVGQLKLRPFFLDNTDPQGFERVFREIGPDVAHTLTVVTSKSGKTKETRNGMLEAREAYRCARPGQDVPFKDYFVAITEESPKSELYQLAAKEGWQTFPMWDWVGGRTSVFSAVGLLPAALLGLQVNELLRGAREMDEATREPDHARNPAALLASMWHHAGRGRGAKDMVVLPYRDRLILFPRYLQQLVMESLGKARDLRGWPVHQGIVVYGNKGSTDQHAYVQQLRDGADNFFLTFIDVLRDGLPRPLTVDEGDGITSGDYLGGFLYGTRKALAASGRQSITITLESLDEASLGRLIALYDRAVGLYASLIGINGYHQPGVEAGKVAAERLIKLERGVLRALSPTTPRTAEQLTPPARAFAAKIPPVEKDTPSEEEEREDVYHILRRLAANPERGVERIPGDLPAEDRFRSWR